MTDSTPETPLAALSEFMSERFGLHFPPERWTDLQDGIAAAAAEFRFKDVDSCARWLLSSSPSKAQLETLVGCFTIGETYFFRQNRQFEVLEEKIIPEIIRARRNERRLRIWSAGCCTGEEAYSLAIVLDKFAAQLAGWHVSILATDVNPKFLRKAEAGVYGDWSFREVPHWIKEKYFRKLPQGKLEILPHLKKAVTFSLLNLAEDAYPSLINGTNAMDAVFCRNVLMYFRPDRAADAVARLKLCLVERGSLFVSPSEVSSTAFSGFETVHSPDVTVYRRRSGRRDGPPAVAAPAEEAAAPPPPARPDAAPPAEASPQALVLRARELANEGRLDEALACCDEALAREKMNAATYHLKGAVLQEQGRTEEAAASFRRALYLDADFILSHFSLGNLAHRARRPDEAGSHYKTAIAILSSFDVRDIPPGTDGLTAGRLREIAAAALSLLGDAP